MNAQMIDTIAYVSSASCTCTVEQHGATFAADLLCDYLELKSTALGLCSSLYAWQRIKGVYVFAYATRKPWEHVISATVAAYAFNWVVEQEDYLIKRIEEHYQQLSDKKSS